MSDAFPAATNRTATAVVELTIEGLQWMLLRVVLEERADGSERKLATRGAPCEVWLDAYDAAPEAIRESLARSFMNNEWTPAIKTVFLTKPAPLGAFVVWATPLSAFVWATKDDKLSDAAIKRLFRVLLFSATNRRAMVEALFRSALHAPRAFALLIAEPSADAALSGPTRCSAGDAQKTPRHHSVRSEEERVTVLDVLYGAARSDDPAMWRAFTDARLPFGARAMDEEWAYALTGPCGCAGAPRIDVNPLREAIALHRDEAGEWLAARLPPKRLNERDVFESTPLIEALRSHNPMPRTVAALLSRVPDVDLARRWRFVDGKERNAAEWMASQPRYWHPPHLVEELKLKTEQFGSQYLPSAAVLCTEQLFVRAGVPRELVNLVLQYTALPQPNRWLTAPATLVAC